MNNKGLKIVVIGGGSSYTPEFVEGLIKRYDEFKTRELWLVDVEAGRAKLEIIGNLAARMIKKAGLDIQIHATIDREKALYGADFVNTQIRVGQIPARVLDEAIPLEHGILGQETNGAGGLFKGLRTVPVILDIAQDISRLCPDAWMLNFSNPVGIVTEALCKYGAHKRFVGICNLPIGTERGLARAMEVEPYRLRVDFAGLNHMVYGFDVFIDNENVTERVFEKFLDDETVDLSVRNIPDYEWEREFVKALKLFPCSYHRYYYKASDMLAHSLEDYKTGGTRARKVEAIEAELFKLYQDPDLMIKPAQLEQRGGAYYSDAACNIMSSIHNDKKDLQTVDVVNNGAVADIDDDSAVEVTCRITKEGPVPFTLRRKLPVSIKGLVMQIKSFEQLAAEAAVTGDYHTGLLAMVTNPLVANDVIGKKVYDRLLEAHKQYLPKFLKES